MNVVNSPSGHAYINDQLHEHLRTKLIRSLTAGIDANTIEASDAWDILTAWDEHTNFAPAMPTGINKRKNP